MPPTLVEYSGEDDYRRHFAQVYCQAQIYTFDGIRVFFKESQFDDAFFESQRRYYRDKSLFSWDRARRIDWIKAALEATDAELYVGWDRDDKKPSVERRVAVVFDSYVVIIHVNKSGTATFITAYMPLDANLAKIRSGEIWKRK